MPAEADLPDAQGLVCACQFDGAGNGTVFLTFCLLLVPVPAVGLWQLVRRYRPWPLP